MADSAAIRRLPILAARRSGEALPAGVAPGQAHIALAVADEKGNPVGGANSLRHFADVSRHAGTCVIPAIPSLLVAPVVAIHRRRGGER
ncbi:hypothetical protein ACI2JR_13535 [Klebsiella sp. NPDC088457]